MSINTDWKGIRILMQSMIDALEAIDGAVNDDTERQRSLYGPLRPGTVMELIVSCTTIAQDLKYQIVQTANYPKNTKYLRHDLRSIFMHVADAASELIGYEATVAEDGLPTQSAIATETHTASMAKFMRDQVPKALSRLSRTDQGLMPGNA